MKLHISDSQRFMEDSLIMQDYYSNLQPIDGLLGFMELLGMQPHDHHHHVSTTTMVNQDYSFNSPATPNSSSISSDSVAAIINNNNIQKETPLLDDDADEANYQHPKTKKELKAKKTRQKEARFAFMTKSEIDHLEDGYRWRKYGQKAVKNSPFPRSYYRCTTASCSVKKRVERSFSDPAIVVTTYEGQHTHPKPTMPRSPFSSFSYVPFADQMILSSHQQLTHLNNFSTNHMVNSPAVARFSSHNSGALTDNGLLEDIVPNWSCVKKEGM